MLVRPYHKNLFILLTIGIWTSSREGRGFPGGSMVKNPTTYAGDMGSIPGEGNGNPLQCSCLENPRDGAGPGGLPSLGLHRVRHD